jgi:hypothetical protein
LARKNYDNDVLHRKETHHVHVLPRGSTFNQLYVMKSIFPDLKTTNLNFRCQKTGPTFWVHINNSTYHNEPKVTLKIQKNHIYRMSHPPYSPDITHHDFSLLGVLKQTLRDREFSLSNEIEDATA